MNEKMCVREYVCMKMFMRRHVKMCVTADV